MVNIETFCCGDRFGSFCPKKCRFAGLLPLFTILANAWQILANLGHKPAICVKTLSPPSQPQLHELGVGHIEILGLEALFSFQRPPNRPVDHRLATEGIVVQIGEWGIDSVNSTMSLFPQ